MRLYSTRDRAHIVSLREAVIRGLPPDKGLYMPCDIPRLSENMIAAIRSLSLPEIGFSISKALFNDEIPDSALSGIVEAALTFPAPVVEIAPNEFVLELFHGPTLAFKDFGARFMARLMEYFNRDEDKELVILVATSGDTGSAVAAGFHGIEGIEVVILYPSGKVSPLQEKQLTTWGGNVKALEILGTFDDCQRLVKSAFVDEELSAQIRLSSANSINIARLVPQSFYYFEALKQVKGSRQVVFSVPSGNFGNLTAGVLAKRMGLPVEKFIAATNVNDVVPIYLKTGEFMPRPSVRTISNAMDVGNPSNFERLKELYGSTWNNMKRELEGYSFDDASTVAMIQKVYRTSGYVLDPHGAVGYLAWSTHKLQKDGEKMGIILETAHPAKFVDVVQGAIGREIQVPERLRVFSEKEKKSILMEADYDSLKMWLMQTYS